MLLIFKVLAVLAYSSALLKGWFQTIAYNSRWAQGMAIKLCHYVRNKILGKVAKFHCHTYSWSKVMKNKPGGGAQRAPPQGE